MLTRAVGHFHQNAELAKRGPEQGISATTVYSVYVSIQAG